MKNYKNDKERETLIHNCKTILNEDKIFDNLSKTEKSNYADFTLRKNLNEHKTHKKYNSHFDGNNKLIESGKIYNFEKRESNRDNKFESNKEFLDNYTNYVNKFTLLTNRCGYLIC